jgi:hypothetical protein
MKKTKEKMRKTALKLFAAAVMLVGARSSLAATH